MKVLIKYLRLAGLITLVLGLSFRFFLNSNYYKFSQVLLVIGGICFTIVLIYIIIKTLLSKYVNFK